MNQIQRQQGVELSEGNGSLLCAVLSIEHSSSMHHHSADCHHSHSTTSSIELTTDPTIKQTQLAIALLLIGTFALVEFGMGWMSHSLALIAESGHMASDGFALVLALLATWITRLLRSRLSSNPPLETAAALINGIALVVMATWIGWEAIQHLQFPPKEIATVPMLLTACAGTVVNGVNVAVLHRGSAHDLNLKAAFLHVLADTISSIGVVVAAIAIALLHWLWADGVISLFVAGLILMSALPLIIESTKTLLQLGK
ncbi:MAG: cation diffusion facilitator family transporter [Leptolyngbyaceae cyanobacterium HOT.MB2.61]|nr:cation diffusion facilitator family transporter [Leptolyngbyaceae cyanobacterium HOT.MB2.61]